jgi:MoaA/NifB/PqqE/SkfB family radical SAM enzyme
MKELQLELTTNCNSSCKMCPRSKLRRSLGFIDTEFAKKIIDNAYELGVRMIKPQWFGESILHPDYFEIVNYAKLKGLRVVIFTNGSLMNKELVEKLINIGVEKICFSIDSSNKEQYERIREGLKFKTTISNLKDAYLLSRNTNTKIIVSAVDFNDGNLRNFFIDLCDEIIINQDIFSGKELKKVMFCLHNVSERLVVSYDGKCYLCCHDWLGDYLLGDLKKQTLKEIIESKTRRLFLSNLDKLEICQSCVQ